MKKAHTTQLRHKEQEQQQQQKSAENEHQNQIDTSLKKIYRWPTGP